VDPKKNVFFTSMGLFLPSIFTYIFWFIVAKINGPESVGIASTIVSFVIILSTIFSFDLHIGMKRLLAKYSVEQNENEYANIFTSVLLFLTISSSVASVLMFYPINTLEIIGIGSDYYWIIIVAIFLLSYHNLFIESFISSMRSKDFFTYIFLGSLLRFPFLAILYILDDNDLSTILSYYVLYFTVITFSMLFYIKKIKFKIPISIWIQTIRSLITISTSSWIPNIINVCGFWMGVIIVYSLDGSEAGGQFYIAVGIFSVVMFIVSGISKVTHGIIQTIQENNQPVYLSYSIKMALALTIPVSTSLLFFSSSYLGILGEEFERSQFNLSILMLGMPFVIISELVYYYLYGLGHHKQVLMLGLIGNIPRVMIYFLITFLFDSTFAALSYFVGSVTQSLFSFQLCNIKIQVLKIKKNIFIIFIPMVVAIPLWLLNLNFILSTVIILLGSVILYIRLDFLDKTDVSKILYAMLPSTKARHLSELFEKVILLIKK
jgi:O-antigen/teichoic acid export membrane protein